MSTSRSQRIGIWVIAVVMVVGTIGSFFVIVLQNKNSEIDQASQEKLLADYKTQQAAEQAKNRPLDGYASQEFDPATVTELTTENLVEGEGAEAQLESGLVINYFGWTSNGKIFDSTNKEGVTTPTDKLKLSGVIEGWKEGLVGKKAGSTVKLTIPAEKAYGSVDTGMGSPVGPLMFIIEIKEVK